MWLNGANALSAGKRYHGHTTEKRVQIFAEKLLGHATLASICAERKGKKKMMMSGISDDVFIVCTAVLFVTVVIGGMFASNAASIWLKNRREERANKLAITESRHDEQHERERNEWAKLLREKDAYIKSLHNELLRESRRNELAIQLLRKFDAKLNGKEQDDANADE